MSIATGSFLRVLFCLLGIFSLTAGARSETVEPPPPLVEIPPPEPPAVEWRLLAGTAGGLYSLDASQDLTECWSGGAVRRILPRAGTAKAPAEWLILSGQGIFASQDLEHWEGRNRGLPVKVIKIYKEGKKSFISQPQEIKDLAVNPQNPEILAAAVNNGVFLSRNGGREWKPLGMPPYRSNGIKSVAVFSMPREGGGEELIVLCSHSIYGVHYLLPDQDKPVWTEMNEGIEVLETTENPDEVSDMAVFPGNPPRVYLSQTFRQRIYHLDWENRRFLPLWQGEGEGKNTRGGVDSLDAGIDSLRFLREGEVLELSLKEGNGAPPVLSRPDILEFIKGFCRSYEVDLQSLVLSWGVPGAAAETISLSELWLLKEKTASPSTAGREGLYLPVNHALDAPSLAPYLDKIERGNLNMVVVDMKDDYGRLRFTPRNEALLRWGRVFWPVDIDLFLERMKGLGIYTIARVVVFKDPEVVKKEKGRYAVWDTRNNEAWMGYRMNGDEKVYYDERWVDPYAEEFWEYIAALSAELHDRGFDEIQFDYIRFPTDGINLGDAVYRWKDPGMDMESAIVSFLRHIRSRVEAPLSVDIYGANGWYRTGARTGQEVELLAPLVDVICPMYYPSHFEQYFLAQDPPEERPYRIYYQGTRRTAIIARNRIIVRPWAQAFYLNVSYDKKYYGPDYVIREVQGVRDAGNGGWTFWNNSGRYEDVPTEGGDPVGAP